MKTEHIHYVLETAKYPSVHKASEGLCLNQQHLATIIANVEKEIGYAIFNRSTKGLSLTPEGKAALGVLQKIDDRYNDLLKIAGNEASSSEIDWETEGNFYIYLQPVVKAGDLSGVFDAVMQRFPKVRFSCVDHVSSSIVDMVANNKNSVGVMLTESVYELPKSELPENVDVIRAKRIDIAALVSKNSDLAKKNKTISMKRFLEEDIVVYDETDNLEKNIFYQIMNQFGKPKVRCVTGNLHLCRECITKSSCVTLVGISGDDHFSSDTTIVPIRDTLRLTANIIVNKEPNLSHVAQCVKDEIRKGFI